MANKQIIDYTLGSFDPQALLLQQPSAGGIYNKVAILQLLGFDYIIGSVVQIGSDPPNWISSVTSLSSPGTWSRNSIGSYSLNNTAAFNADKTAVFIGSAISGFYTGSYQSDNEVLIESSDSSTNAADDLLAPGYILIIILP